MSEWPKVRLGDHIDLLTGFPFPSKTYTQDPQGVRLLSGYNIVQGELRWERFNRLPVEYSNGLDRYWLKPDDVVLAMDRPWIDAGLKYAWIRNEDSPSLLVQRTARLRGSKTLDTRFLRYLVGSSTFSEHINSVTTGTAVPHISPDGIKSFRFELPPFSIQRRIAAILGRLDDKLQLNRRTNRTLEAMAQALYKHWFVDFGPFQDGEFMESEMGMVPKGWEVGTTQDILDLAYGKGLPERQRTQGLYPVVGSNGRIDSHADYLVAGPGIVVGRKGTIGRLTWIEDNFWPIDTTFYVIPRRDVFAYEYVYHVLGGLDLENRNTDSAVPGLNRNEVYRLPVILPPDEVLLRFAMLVRPWFAQMQQIQLESTQLTATRDYLLPKLVSGEVDVSESLLASPHP